MKLKDNANFVIGLVMLIITTIYIFFLFSCCKNSLVTQLISSNTQYYSLFFLLIADVFFAIKEKKLFKILVFELFFFFAWLSIVDSTYSPIDESLHFDNINHIVKYNTLSTFFEVIDYRYLNEASGGSLSPFVNFEAVQAPLYYILLACIGKCISGAFIRLHTFRIISLGCVLIVYFYIFKTIQLFKKNGYDINEEIYRFLLLITIFNPAYLYRASRLNNEILLCVLCSILLYEAIQCIFQGYNKKKYWVIAFLCMACFMTKSTAIYVYIVFGIIILIQKKEKEAVLPLLTSSLFTAPWFVFNYTKYGHLTAMSEHLNIVLPLVNAGHVDQNIYEAFAEWFFVTFFTGEETTLSYADLIWIYTISILFVFIVISLVKFIILEIKNNSFRFEDYNKKNLVNLVCVSLILACIAILVVGTISTKIVSIRGRYFYASCIALILPTILNYEELFDEKIKKLFYLVGVMVIGTVITRNLTQHLDRYCGASNVYACDVESIDLCDMTDSNWTHGFSNNSNKLLIEITDANKDNDYSCLIGRVVTDGYEASVITGITNNIYVDGTQYLYLVTSNLFESEHVFDNKLYVKGFCSSVIINTQTTTILSPAEELEVMQTIRTPVDCKMLGCSVMLGTYNAESYSANVCYTVLSENNEILQQGVTYIDNVSDNTYCDIYFEDEIAIEKDDCIKIMLKFDNIDDFPLAIYISEGDAYLEGTLTVEGTEFSDNDLGLKILIDEGN